MNNVIVIGDITIRRIVEQEGPFLPALDVFPTLTAELLDENRHWLAPEALSRNDKLVFAFQSYLVQTPRHTILVDSCIGNDKVRPTRPEWNLKRDETFMRALAAAGFGVEDIDFVVCTHMHVDHVGWNTRLLDGRWIPTFPKARYLFAKGEFDYWTEQHAKTPAPPFGDSVLPIVEAGRAEFVRDDHAVDEYVRLLPTPGHTPHHVSVCFGRDGDVAVMTGDLLHSPLQARYPELSSRFDVDRDQSAKTRRRFFERYCGTRTLCCTAHFPSPSVGRITAWDNGFRCELAEA
ncbi:MAG: MBL fold metallo-hydrolase [Roseiarcus sp.]|uniref:MBL fold metallo-hydrolase n=1 Tax=Roseiarcus sp. TaxID=1969460 RepID=UPI003C4534F3